MDREGINISEVAKYFTELGPMEVRKLQILCFYTQVWHLVFTGGRFINSDFQAWAHGPTSKILNEEYKEWENLVIPKMEFNHNLTLTDNQKEYINKIYNLYKDYSAQDLESLSKSEQPYINARKGVPDGDPCWNVINDESIEKYYKNYLYEDKKEKPTRIMKIFPPNYKN